MRRHIFVAAALLIALNAAAHDLPLSYVDMKISNGFIDATIEASAKDFVRELPSVDEATLLDIRGAKEQMNALAALLASRLVVSADGNLLPADLLSAEPLPIRKDLRLRLRFTQKQTPASIHVRCDLFTSDPRHKIFLNIYEHEQLKHQAILDQKNRELDYFRSDDQKIGAVVAQFIREGIHHIFLGPDHILFIIGLMLLGGTLGRLLRIVTAFTIAHSITLVLAALNLLSPPARLIEPAIAVSIVFVGTDALLRREGQRDWRLLFAFCFGFVHGFGFANVLREMQLPREALGWSLFSFNAGVEIGQACIVLTVAPLLSALRRWNASWSRWIVTSSAAGVIVAGSFWFFQRLCVNL